MLLVACCAALACSPVLGSPAARAALPRAYRFDIPSQSLEEALVQFALQAHLSINTPNGRAGSVRTQSLSGSFTVEEGLRRLLSGTGFGFEIVDADTVRITRAKRATSASDGAANDEIVVTATKLPAPLDRLPYSISVLTGAQLSEQRIAGARDIATQLAGVTVTNLGPGRNKILIRGISDGALTGTAQSTVGNYLDDAQITYNAPDPDLKLVDIDKVEVLRGPEGTLYGSGSIGGIYRIVTNKPDLQDYSGLFTLGGAITAHGEPSSEVSGVANLPLVPGRLSLRVVGYGEQLGGYINDKGGPNDVNRLVRQGERITLKLALDDNWSLTGGFNQQTINTDDSQYVTSAYSGLTRPASLREPHDNDFTQAYLHADGSLGWGVFTSSSSFVRHEINSRYDATPALAFFSTSSAQPSPFDDKTVVRMWTEEMRLNAHPAARIQWLTGLFLAHASNLHSAVLTTYAADSADRIGYSEDREDQISDVALFGDIYVPLTRSLTVGAGLRWFASSLNVKSTVSQPPLASSRFLNRRLGLSGIAPKLEVTFRSSGSVMIYAQAAEGYRVGGFNTSGLVNQTFADSASGPQPFLRYGKDELWNYEIGAKLALLHGRLHVRGALFWDVWKNLQVEQFLPSGLSFTGNAGDAQNRGLELEMSYDVWSGLNLQTNLIVNDPELANANPTFPAISDAGLLSVAHVSGGLSMTYIRQMMGGLSAVFGANINYVGTSHFTFGGVKGDKMGGLLNARIHVDVQNDRWRLSAYLENLGDTTGNTFSYGNPFSLHTGRQSTPLRPRTAGLSVSRRF